MTLGYKKLSNVLNYIPKSLQNDLNDSEQWQSWALQALRTVLFNDRYINDIALIEIIDHRACLPDGIKRITSIEMYDGNATEAEIAALLSQNKYDSYLDDNTPMALGQGEDSEVSYSDSSYLLYHQIFLASSLFQNRFKPMRYIGKTNNKNFFSSSCWARINSKNCLDCFNEFSITTDKCLLTEAKTGWVCIQYEREPKDSDGDFLVIEEPIQLWQGIANYAIAQYWLEQTGYNKQGAYSLFERHLSISNTYLKETKGILTQMQMNLDVLDGVMFNESLMLKLPSVWTNR